MARVNTSHQKFFAGKNFSTATPKPRNPAKPKSEKFAIANPPHPMQVKRRHGFEDVKIFEGVAACLIFAPEKKIESRRTDSTYPKKSDSRR